MALNGEQICHKQWTEAESQQSSTWRELSAIEFALKSFSPMLNHSYVKWYSDRQVACTIARVGNMRRDLHGIALRIYQLCLEHGVEFEIDWIPRAQLQKADFLSRLIDIDDWQITRECFDALEKLWGTPHFRLFCELLQCKNFQICDLALELEMLGSRLFCAKSSRGKLFSGASHNPHRKSIVLLTETKSLRNRHRTILAIVILLARYKSTISALHS